VSGPEAALQRALIRLSARRGCLPWLPELGSRLYTLRSTRPGERESYAVAYVSEALAPEPEVRVESVSVRTPEPDRLEVEVALAAGGRRGVVTIDANP